MIGNVKIVSVRETEEIMNPYMSIHAMWSSSQNRVREVGLSESVRLI
jgi:hypothetical protein